uniref:Uncharacterized protein n=1 Tax=Bionectria ochroleuca TaxID=29856 RepID=A0A8H7N7U8_BIOOC
MGNHPARAQPPPPPPSTCVRTTALINTCLVSPSSSTVNFNLANSPVLFPYPVSPPRAVCYFGQGLALQTLASRPPGRLDFVVRHCLSCSTSSPDVSPGANLIRPVGLLIGERRLQRGHRLVSSHFALTLQSTISPLRRAAPTIADLDQPAHESTASLPSMATTSFQPTSLGHHGKFSKTRTRGSVRPILKNSTPPHFRRRTLSILIEAGRISLRRSWDIRNLHISTRSRRLIKYTPPPILAPREM